MLANLKALAQLPDMDTPRARFVALETAAAEFDAEVADGKIYNVTASNMKDALSLIQRLYEKSRDMNGGLTRADDELLGATGWTAPYADLQYCIDGVTVKKAIKSLEAALKFDGLSTYGRQSASAQLLLAQVFAACNDELRSHKDVLIKGRKPTKPAKTIYGDTPIALAVAPLKERAVDLAETQARNRIATVKSVFESNGWDLEKVAPYPQASRLSKDQYRTALAKHNYFGSFVTSVASSRRMIDPDIVVWNPEAVERNIKAVREMTASNFEAYVYKLNEKVGAHKAAELEIGSNYLWSDSTVKVTKADGTTERWNTKTIINYSGLGTMFNQWPTRLIK